jgi:hypothetical protein
MIKDCPKRKFNLNQLASPENSITEREASTVMEVRRGHMETEAIIPTKGIAEDSKAMVIETKEEEAITRDLIESIAEAEAEVHQKEVEGKEALAQAEADDVYIYIPAQLILLLIEPLISLLTKTAQEHSLNMAPPFIQPFLLAIQLIIAYIQSNAHYCSESISTQIRN